MSTLDFHAYNRVVFVSAMDHKKNLDNRESVLLAEACTVPTEADCNAAGFDGGRGRSVVQDFAQGQFIGGGINTKVSVFFRLLFSGTRTT